MGCRLILNLCQVYEIRDDTVVRAPSIWAASEGIRFKSLMPSSVAAVPAVRGEDWALERGPSTVSNSTMEAKVHIEGAYELYDIVPLGGAKGCGDQ